MCVCVVCVLEGERFLLKARWTLLNFIFGLWCRNTMNISLSPYIVNCYRVTVKLNWEEKFFWMETVRFENSFPVLSVPVALISLHCSRLSAFHLHSSSIWLYVFMCKMKEYLISMFCWHFKLTFMLNKNWAGKAKHPINGLFCALRRF